MTNRLDRAKLRELWSVGPDKFENPVCRGAFALGTACGKCERCKKYLTQLTTSREAIPALLDELDRIEDAMSEKDREIEALRGLVEELADDLAPFINNEYPEDLRLQYPRYQQRYALDMEVVNKAREMLK